MVAEITTRRLGSSSNDNSEAETEVASGTEGVAAEEEAPTDASESEDDQEVVEAG